MSERLSLDVLAARVAKEFQDGDVVNLGVGIGTLVGNYLPEEIHVILHAENGLFGHGRVLTVGDEDLMDWNLVNAGLQFVAPQPGMSFGTIVDAFGAVRTGRVDKAVLGAYQVSEKGDLANYAMDPQQRFKTIGGAMDIALGAKQTIAAMLHTDKHGKPKIVKRCTLPLTAIACVDLIVTDVAFISVTSDGLLLREVAPGWTAEQVQAITEPELIIAPDLKEIEL